jgi:hypothetical protein
LDHERGGESALTDLIVEIALDFRDTDLSKFLSQVCVGQSFPLQFTLNEVFRFDLVRRG